MDKKSKPAIFKVGGRLVNAQGQEVDESGKVLGAAGAGVSDDLQAKLDDLQERYDELQETYERAGLAANAADARTAEAYDKLQAVNKERDALQAKLDAIKPIPDNALELLKSVKGIGDETAQKALDALTSGKPSDGK